MQRYTAKEIADVLKVGNSTIRAWGERFEVPRQRKGTKWIYTEEAKQIFETIKHLRDKEHSYDTIVKRLTGAQQEPYTSQAPAREMPDRSLMGQIEQVIHRQLQENNELSEKYAKATYTIGKQEERIATLESENRHLKEQLALLPPLEHWQASMDELDGLKKVQQKPTLWQRLWTGLIK